MPAYAGPSTPARTGDVAGTLRLLAYLALAITLIVLDHRGGWLTRARQQAQLLVQPLRAVAGWPGRMIERISDDAGTLGQLTTDNRRLRNELLVTRARMARLATVNADNARLRGLLDAAQKGNLDVQLAPILDIDLDPTRQRLVIDAGSNDGVRVGQNVIDAGGLLGQIIEITPMHANVLLLTDPSHAVPVAIARNGVRLVAYGTGRTDQLALASVPLSSDVKVGDVLVTSGLGGRFAAGFPVGTIVALRPDESRAFLLGEVRPAALLDRGRDVLLLRTLPSRPVIGAEGPGLGTAAASAAAARDQPGNAAAPKPTETPVPTTPVPNEAGTATPPRDQRIPNPESPIPAPPEARR